MYRFPSLMQRPERNTPSIRKRPVSSFDYKCSLFSLVTSLLVYLCSMALIAAMVYYKYSVKWTFVCYLASSGWILVMNITSNVVMISSRKKVMREIQRPVMRASVNLDLLNDPDSSRCLSSPPGIRSQLSSRIGQCDSTSHTPPPPYEDLSQISEENPTNEAQRYVQLEAPPEARMEKIADLDREYHQENTERRGCGQGDRGSMTGRTIHQDVTGRKIQQDVTGRKIQQDMTGRAIQLDMTGRAIQLDMTGRTIQQDMTGRTIQQDMTGRTIQQDMTGRSIQQDMTGRAIQQDMTGRAIQHGQLTGTNKGAPDSSETARRLLRVRIEERRNQLDRKLEGDSLRKMNEYCMRDLRREGDVKKSEDLRQLSEPSMMKVGGLTPKESLRRNLKAKYRSSADNLVDMSRVTSVYDTRNMDRCELPRVHMKSTLSLRDPKTSNRPSHDDVKTARLTKSGLSLQDVRLKADIAAANEVGLPLEKTWRQKPHKMPDRALPSKNSDESISTRHSGENRNGREGSQCGVSSYNSDKPFSGRKSGENRNGREGSQCGIQSSNSDKPFCVRKSGDNRTGRESSQCGISSSNLDKPFSGINSREIKNGRESDQCGISSSDLDKQFSVRQSEENITGREQPVRYIKLYE